MIWRPIETYKVGDWVLAYAPALGPFVGAQEREHEYWIQDSPNGWLDREDMELREFPTHWMPLPEPPVLSLTDKLDLLAEKLNES